MHLSRANKVWGAAAPLPQDLSLLLDCPLSVLLFIIFETEKATISIPKIMGTQSIRKSPYPKIITPPVKLSHCIDGPMILPPATRSENLFIGRTACPRFILPEIQP
jgi:hypothetical protein